ncbi:MAG: type III pantothenate kinase, partial [Spirochaetales bacterium]|nr:type III pantothenate kinase [Spirochaetales bacterium]
MILVFDVGNTNIEVGIFLEEFGNEKVLATARRFTRREESADEFAFFVLRFLEVNNVKVDCIKKIIFSSVVPQLNFCFYHFATKYFSQSKVIEVSSKVNLGINNKYKNPAEVGADRLVNAAYVFYKYKCNSIIIDMGT